MTVTFESIEKQTCGFVWQVAVGDFYSVNLNHGNVALKVQVHITV